MNYLKLIDLEKSRRSLLILTSAIAFIFTSCKNQQAKSQVATDSLYALPNTYVTTNESGRRLDWFDKYKYPVLDSMTWKEERVHETKKLNFDSLDIAIKFFDSLISGTSSKDTITGVRVYFASQTLKPGGCGKLTLIFTATVGYRKTDVGKYYTFNKEVFDASLLDTKTAKEWVSNYQQKKWVNLSKYTMDATDTCKYESKHIFFSLKQIKSIIDEMKYQQAKHSAIVKGFGVRFASYTDQDYLFLNIKPIKYHKRLTIGFTFIDWEGEDIGIKQIDAGEFLQRLQYTKEHKDTRGDTFDTGIPAPPPSDTKEALDSQI
ncbi:hypothetical protein [Pedobacter jeongneungensis]|uniref:hypothetical protein n=1 Tax=Pedobacter jeongneungensis TaxID=947309 RepID=UPI00046A2C5E|nr:hypothetical protein [Pedobacter jeongneungensis]